jgi:cytochrome c peroxidase
MMRRNLAATLSACATLWLAGCSDDTTAPSPGADPVGPPRMAAATAAVAALAAEVRGLAANQSITPITRPAPVRRELSVLGRALAFDKVLSGNRDISCMTCHLAKLATVDGRSVAIGTGGTGLGLQRTHPLGTFVHRSAPPLFNLSPMRVLTWDGRVFLNTTKNLVRTPTVQLTAPQLAALEFGPVSALPMFPVLSRVEMRGTTGNELAAVPDSLPRRTWVFLMARLGAIPQYRTMFEAAYPGQVFDSLNFAHAGNAIGGWITDVFSFANSPWDRMLAGDDDAMTEQQLRGARAFLTTAKCSLCHAGALLTDQKFHNVAVPQVGPGFGDGPTGHDDFGRMRESKKLSDKYRFRTPPLRNVELTAPYGHDGAIVTLRGWVDHYTGSDVKLRNYDVNQLEPALRGTLQPTTSDILLTRDTRLKTLVMTQQTVDDISEFLKSLTDPAARDMRSVVPTAVPSGLPVDNLP